MKNLLTVIFLAVQCACNTQVKSIAEDQPVGDTASSSILFNSIDTADGIIFFSHDNGLTWENKSNGLSATVKLGLGAIAASGNLLAVSTKDSGVYFFDFDRSNWEHIPTSLHVVANNPGALILFMNRIYIGTQYGGVFSSIDRGKNWVAVNSGLTNLTIRKLVDIDHKLYAGTNKGLFAFDESKQLWSLEYGNSTLQVNGVTALDRNIYIGTNQGVFTASKDAKEWKQVLANRSIHNISSDDNTIYAMAYNELFSSVDKGKSWQNIQSGLPARLYTFNVVKHGSTLFAGQWDGVYRKEHAGESWRLSNDGIPEKFAVTNIALYKGIIVVSGSERKLRAGMKVEK
jgi:photosystem II stability/assembly factor-like uncharacterized protein